MIYTVVAELNDMPYFENFYPTLEKAAEGVYRRYTEAFAGKTGLLTKRAFLERFADNFEYSEDGYHFYISELRAEID